MTNSIIGDIPPFQCWVRKEFLRAQVDGHGEFEEGIAIGAVVRKDMALCFTVLLESGALWYELPLHALAIKESAPLLDITECQMWDCLSSQWIAHRYDHLRHLTAFVWLNKADGSKDLARGSYMFTIDMMGTFYADHPSEHKTLNIIELDDGQVVAYPNNRCLFEDKTFTKINGRLNYIQTNQHFFCETWAGPVQFKEEPRGGSPKDKLDG